MFHNDSRHLVRCLCCLRGCSAHTHREREVISQHPGLQPQSAAAHSSPNPLTRYQETLPVDSRSRASWDVN
jgi:hypothetical protein